MSLTFWLVSPLLAQSDSSTVADFMGQIGGLLIFTCAVGVLWIILLAVIMQRATERRRRSQLGLEPLPALHISAYRQLMKLVDPKPAPRPFAEPEAQPTRKPRRADSLPAPDLGMLTADLPQPDLSAMLGDDIPAYADRAAAPAANFPTHTETYEDQPLEIDSTPLMEEEMPTGDRQDPPDSVELLRVWRDLSDGSLIVEIGGRQFRSLNDLRSGDLERRFLNVLRDLTTLSTSSAAAASAAPARPRPAAPTAVPPAAPSPESKTPKDKMPDQDAENGPVSLSPGSMFRQMRRVAMGQGPAPVERKPEQTIAEQIEDILQARLVDLPEFRKRSIHVSPALSGGVRIEVDGQFYDGVGDVEDQAVRDLLIEVVRVWEQSQ